MKHNIDKYFEDNLKHRSFDVEAEDWAKMSAMLQENKESKKPVFWIWILGLAIVIGSVITYSLYQATSDQLKTNTESQDIVSSNSRDNNIQGSMYKNESIISDKYLSDRDNSSRPSAELAKDNSLDVQIETSNSELHKTTIISSSKSINNNIGDVISSTSFDEATVVIKADDEIKLDHSIGQNDSNILIEGRVNKSELSGIVEAEQLKEEGMDISMQLYLIRGKLDVLKINPLNNSDKLQVVDIKMDYLDVLTESEEHKFDYIETPMSRSISVYGGGIVYPFSRPTGSPLIGYRAGLVYTDVLRNQFGWSVGVGVRQLSGNYLSAEESSIITHGNSFSWDMDYLSLTPEQVYFLEVPLAIHYKKRSHIFSAGLNVNITLASQGVNRSESYNQTELVGVNQYQVPSRIIVEDRVWMSTSSFNPVYVQLNLGYKYQILPRVKLGLGLEYGVNDISKSELLLDDKSLFIHFGTEINLWK